MKTRDGSPLIPGPCLHMIKHTLLMVTVSGGLSRKAKGRISLNFELLFQIPFGSEACISRWKHIGKRHGRKLVLFLQCGTWSVTGQQL